jgi:hypothetical protein
MVWRGATVAGDAEVVLLNAAPPPEVLLVLVVVVLVFVSALLVALATAGTFLGVAIARTRQSPEQVAALPRGNPLLLAIGSMAVTVPVSLLALTVGGEVGEAVVAGGRANGVLGLVVVLGAVATWGWWNATRRRYH